MKLPEDKKERTKILVLIGIGVVVVLYLIVQFGILPYFKAKRDKLAKIEQVKIDIGNANREIAQHEKDKVENLDILRKITDVSDKYVIKPVLGNYKISASEVIEPITKKLNLKIDQFRPVGLLSEASQTSFRAFSARLTTVCSYEELICFIREIENNNPLISVLNISITGQGQENKEKHKVVFEVQWPAWADPEIPVQLAKQLNDLSKTPESGTK
ncbi:MAG: hypothetical protein PHI84_18790 [Kiritimatiellae bacterium]|nr:hypothetical protein [Kiritimatiellia bacterium]